jgi:chemotaxis family two-component system response regulator Rcp1
MNANQRQFAMSTANAGVVRDRPEHSTSNEDNREVMSQPYLRNFRSDVASVHDKSAGVPPPTVAAQDFTPPTQLPGAVAVEILLVEDSPGDIRLTQEALRAAKVKNNLHVVIDGIEATSFLRREGKHTDAPRPDLILLDLNLPKKNGQEVLEDIKLDPQLRTIPVVILTTSVDEEDILRSYKLHANCYITKPVDLDQFLRVVKAIDSFWLTIVKLPKDATA